MPLPSEIFNTTKEAAKGDAVRYLKIQLGIPLATSTPDLSAAVTSLVSASSAALASALALSQGA